MRRTLLLLTLVLAGCQRGDAIFGGSDDVRVLVLSDPPGARIVVDGRETGFHTPDTLRGLVGRHDITPRIDTGGVTYAYNARLSIPAEAGLTVVTGPLLLRCFEPVCYERLSRFHTGNGFRMGVNPAGMLFHRTSSGGNGLFWPVESGDSYVSIGMPMIAGVLNGRDTVALGIYDTPYLAGRPFLQLDEGTDSLGVVQSTWIVPPASLLARATVRGIEVREELLSDVSTPNAAVVRLVFRNNSADASYRTVDPVVGDNGATMTDVYIGFALDPDIGAINDDLLSYAPELDMVFAYDANFLESGFSTARRARPGLVGLAVLESPAGSQIVLNGWPAVANNAADWVAGGSTERAGWYNLSGTRVFEPDHPLREIGYLPEQPGDIRISVSAGPLLLVPGDSAIITVAILFAEPMTGSYESGTVVVPGNPTDPARPLAIIATHLFEAAETVSTIR
jgi:hypothetical protein